MTAPQATIKERPILYGAPMVRAILSGAKTQTRWAVSPIPREIEPGRWVLSGGRNWSHTNQRVVRKFDSKTKKQIGEDERYLVPFNEWLVELCPHGQVSDRLWVRETWHDYGRWSCYPLSSLEADDPKDWHWCKGSPADLEMIRYEADDPTDLIDPSGDHRHHRKMPSIFMPRWASRIALEITDVRVERVQSMSQADAMAEGIGEYAEANGFGKSGIANPVETFAHLWDANRPNRMYPWASNPWCWAISFKRIERERTDDR